jgi:hypothetical protein
MAYTPEQAKQIIQQAQSTLQKAQQLLASAKPTTSTTKASTTSPATNTTAYLLSQIYPTKTTTPSTAATTFTPTQQQQAASLLSQIQEIQQKIGQLQSLYGELQKYGVSRTEELPIEVQQKYGLTPAYQPPPPQVQVGGDIFSMISKIAEQQFAPIRSIMEQYIKGISQKYDDEYLKALQQRQQKEEEELIGKMSERGFDPGSGVTQAALNELRQRHQQEIQNLLAEKERAISSAQLELAKLQQSGLTSLYGLVPNLLSLQLQYQKAQQPQTITHETGIYSHDPTTNTVKQLIAFPTKDKARDIVQDASGQYYTVRESGKVEALGITGAPPKTTTSPYTLTGLMNLQKVKEELGITPDWKITNINKARVKIAAMKIGLPAGRTLASAIQEAILSYAFATSGKQMSWKEAEMRFENLIPGVLDDEATIIYKIKSLENAFKLLGTLPYSPNISTEDQWEKTP